jgi:hypothetical protein
VAIGQFLRARFHPEVRALRYLGAGMFSQAFSFAVVGEGFVLRLNAHAEDLEKDAFAYQHFRVPGLPIPRVVALGPFDEQRAGWPIFARPTVKSSPTTGGITLLPGERRSRILRSACAAIC